MHELQLRSLLDGLRDPRLLAPEKFSEIVHLWLPECRELAVISAELVYRGWLTPFQISTLIQNKKKSLFLGSYVLEDVIGEGGMGIVYRARNWKLDLPVAIKIARPEKVTSPKQVARFIREIQALAELKHPHIIEALDAGFVENRLYFVMEYVGGGDLRKLLEQKGPLSVSDVCLFAIQVADALQYLSSLGIVHRDIKPSNLLLSKEDRQIKLLDMGLARLQKGGDSIAHPALTGTGTILGTPEYMAPEQVGNPSAIDIRSDLYSLGCTLYHLLTGHPPFEGKSAVELMHKHVSHTPVPLKFLRQDLPPQVIEVIEKLMSKRQRDRYSEPHEIVGELLPFVQESSQSCAQFSYWTEIQHKLIPPPKTVEFRTQELRISKPILRFANSG